ncbi:Protein of unknown function [Tenacibaculum sp. MAR_2009_124]|uniref:hypothetical protein n=1 Tax=Tenacibaculum sp. MAR_2009_124 TaxID=1250059 RepID=UPI000899980D|nr:hypothetical protein [Tenacibaculum sp. MAR_2009_124]SED17389.1 Protein of unknown function [Tenacibaculum sp. MAR_2009_124]
MKKLIFILFLSTSVFSQTEEDYSKTLDFISKAFNEQKTEAIFKKFSLSLQRNFREEVLKEQLDSLLKDKGRISSYELIFKEKGLQNFLVELENASMLLLINLSSDGKIKNFEIKDY